MLDDLARAGADVKNRRGGNSGVSHDLRVEGAGNPLMNGRYHRKTHDDGVEFYRHQYHGYVIVSYGSVVSIYWRVSSVHFVTPDQHVKGRSCLL